MDIAIFDRVQAIRLINLGFNLKRVGKHKHLDQYVYYFTRTEALESLLREVYNYHG